MKRGCYRLTKAWIGLVILAGFLPVAAAQVPGVQTSRPVYLPPTGQPNPLSRGILQPPLEKPPMEKPLMTQLPMEQPLVEQPLAGFQGRGKTLPISLDTILRLAQDQNGKVAIALEQLNEAFAGKDLADKSWIPDLFVGTTYYRHEGGIQDFQGFLVRSSYGSFLVGPTIQGTFDLRDFAFKKIDAERKIWQKRGEIAQITTETLLDAASTYIDLLAARSGEVVSLELEKEMEKLLVSTEKLAKVEVGIRVEVARIKGELEGQRQITRKLREGSRSAAAKLIYLLGLDPDCELVPVDARLKSFTLVDDNMPARQLVNLALAQGPGIQEMSGLLALIDDAEAKSQGLGRFIPIVKLCVTEGAFGAGPGSSTTWDNAFNGGISIGWNLNDCCTARERRRIMESKKTQAQLGYQELTSKLSLGVEEALEASRSGKAQETYGITQVQQSLLTYKLSKQRWDNKIKTPIPASPGEVLMGMAGVGRAQGNLINAVRDHDKAQLRLFVLTGQVDRHAMKE